MADLRTMTVTQAVEATGMARNTIYRLLESGAVAGNHVGKRWHLSVASLEAWINRKEKPFDPNSVARAFPEVEDRFS